MKTPVIRATLLKVGNSPQGYFSTKTLENLKEQLLTKEISVVEGVPEDAAGSPKIGTVTGAKIVGDELVIEITPSDQEYLLHAAEYRPYGNCDNGDVIRNYSISCVVRTSEGY